MTTEHKPHSVAEMQAAGRYLEIADARIKDLEEQFEATDRMLKAYVERFGLILPSDEPRAEVTYPARSPFPPPPDLTVGAVDHLTQREDGSWESGPASEPAS